MFSKENPSVVCGNGCNAHFQSIDEETLKAIVNEHAAKCTKANLYKNDPSAFYCADDVPFAAFNYAPDYFNFNLRFLNNEDYAKVITLTTNQRSVSRMETLAIANNENFQLIKFFWDSIIDGLVSPPTAKAIEGWNTIAKECFMPFRFDKTSKIYFL